MQKASKNYETAFEVDVPPSSNNMFVNLPGKGRVRSGEYTRWMRNQLAFLTVQRAQPVIPPVAIKVDVPESIRGDLSNRCKAIEDLVVKAGIIPDDSKKFVRSITLSLHEGKQCKVRVISLAEAA